MADESVPSGDYGDFTAGDKAIAFRGIGDGLVALVFMDVSTPSVPVPKEIRIVPRVSAGSEHDVFEALREWDAVDGPAVSGTHLRALNLGAVTREYASNVRRNQEARDDLGFDPEILIHLDGGQGKTLGFKRFADFKAAMTRVMAAMVYVNAASRGETKPAIAVANELFDGDVSKARSTLAQARKKGYLVGGKPGRVGGELSEEAVKLIEMFKAQADSNDGGPSGQE